MPITFNDCSQILQEAIKGATGQEVTQALNTSQFVAQANTALQTGYDPIMKSLSTVLSKTIFSVRPYYAKFNSLYKDSLKWGAHIRKVTPIDNDPEVDQRGMSSEAIFAKGQELTEYVWNPSNVLQTNIYGGNVYQRSIMLTRDQLDSAFTGPDQFASFVTMILQNLSDSREQDIETMARMCIGNYIAGKIASDTSNVIHLVSEYNTLTGRQLTAATVFDPENYSDFIRFMYAMISDISNKMTERSIKFHTNIEGKIIKRHTPKAMQRLYFSSFYWDTIRSMVLSMTRDNRFMDIPINELVTFWQDIDTPLDINITPSYINASGETTVASEAVAQSNVLGILIDDETVGLTSIHEWSSTTPLDARHGITNIYNHYTLNYWNDFTENGVVFLMD